MKSIPDEPVVFWLWWTNCSFKARVKRGWELTLMRVFVDYKHFRPNKRKLSTTREKLSRFKFDESACEFQAKREQEFELSSTLILVWPSLKPRANISWLLFLQGLDLPAWWCPFWCVFTTTSSLLGVFTTCSCRWPRMYHGRLAAIGGILTSV